MKILYISSVDVSQNSGPSANEREFIPALHDLIGNNSHFVIPEPCNGLPNDITKVNYTFTFPHRNRKLFPWILHQISIVLKVKELLKRRIFDIIVIRADVFAIAYLFITWNFKIPIAMKTAGSGEFKVFQRKNIFFRTLYGFNKWIYKSLVKSSIFVDVVSPAQRDQLRLISGEGAKIQWIDNGVNVKRFYPIDKKICKEEFNLTSLEPIVGYAGNFPWKRGAMQIIESIPQLKNLFPNIGILILGDGIGMANLYNRVNELGISDCCIFTGNVPYDMVPKYINCMDVCVSQRFEETQGASELKVRQYLACGKPVIVSPGGANDFVEYEGLGFIVDPNDRNQFTKKVKSLLLLSENQIEDLSIKARNYALENLSFKAKVQERTKEWDLHLRIESKYSV